MAFYVYYCLVVINVGFCYNAPRPMPSYSTLVARASFTSMSVLLRALMACLLFHLVNWIKLLFYDHFIILYVEVNLALNFTYLSGRSCHITNSFMHI